jgi:amino acid transporter
MALAALFSTSSAINATLYGGANVSYMVAREGELPEMFDRKVWRRAVEGLFITAAVVILVTNTMNLEGIAMMGSALFLVIYTAVNIGHLRLCTVTGANRVTIWISIIGCMAALISLVYYIFQSSPTTLIALLIAIILCFVFEWVYRRISGRTLSKSLSSPSSSIR